jgi:hypothetical protein
MIDCVIKTAMDGDDNIQWQCLYVDGKKAIENYVLDIDLAVSIFAPDSVYQTVTVYESNFDEISSSFPDEEDFSYLMDNRTIEVGDMVWLNDGSFYITEIRESYRTSGYYSLTEWVDNKPIIKSIYYTGHIVTEFRVEGKTECLIWEDYSYQQSDLIMFHKNKKEKKRV